MNDERFEQSARTLAYSLCFLWSRLAASLLRNQTAAMVVIFLWPLALEPLVRLILFAIPHMDDLGEVRDTSPSTPVTGSSATARSGGRSTRSSAAARSAQPWALRVRRVHRAADGGQLRLLREARRVTPVRG